MSFGASALRIGPLIIDTARIGEHLRVIFSGEVAFALFLMSWAYGDEWSHVGPVSIRFVFLCGCSIWFIRRLLDGEFRFSRTAAHTLLGVFIFLAYAFMSLLWSPQRGVGVDRFGVLVFLCVPALLFSITVVQSGKSLAKFQTGLIAGLVVGVFHIYLESRAPSSQFVSTVLDTNGYQGLNRMLGMGGLALCVALGYRFRKGWQVVLTIALLCATISEMIVLGGVTGLVAFAGCMAIFAVSLIDFDRRHLLNLTSHTVILTGMSVLGAIVLLILLNLNPSDVIGLPRGIVRIVAKLHWGGVTSSANIIEKEGRLDLWRAALHIWTLHPFWGSGLGSWSLLAGENSLAGSYAHNIFLEILGELGIFGFLLFITPFVVLLINARRSWYRIPPISRDMAIYFALFCVVHSLVIGNIADYWTFSGLGMLFLGEVYRQDAVQNRSSNSSLGRDLVGYQGQR